MPTKPQPDPTKPNKLGGKRLPEMKKAGAAPVPLALPPVPKPAAPPPLPVHVVTIKKIPEMFTEKTPATDADTLAMIESRAIMAARRPNPAADKLPPTRQAATLAIKQAGAPIPITGSVQSMRDQINQLLAGMDDSTEK